MTKRNWLGVVVLGVGALAASGAAPATQPAEVVAYPLKTCVVSDEDLGSMGTPVVQVYQGQEIKFCCKSCVRAFNKDPEKYLKKMKEQAATTRPAQ